MSKDTFEVNWSEFPVNGMILMPHDPAVEVRPHFFLRMEQEFPLAALAADNDQFGSLSSFSKCVLSIEVTPEGFRGLLVKSQDVDCWRDITRIVAAAASMPGEDPALRRIHAAALLVKDQLRVPASIPRGMRIRSSDMV